MKRHGDESQTQEQKYINQSWS